MNTNMAAATYHPQTGNVKPLTANISTVCSKMTKNNART